MRAIIIKVYINIVGAGVLDCPQGSTHRAIPPLDINIYIKVTLNAGVKGNINREKSGYAC